MGTGEETSTSGAGTARNTDGKETGVFTDSVASAFVEYNVGIVSPGDRKNTSELQSHHDLVCRLLLEKKNTTCCASA